MSPALPARCRNCGYQWDGFGGFDIGAETDLYASGNVMSCPRCGRPAQVLEGRMNIRAGAIEMLEGPQWSWDLVESLGLALRRIVEEPPANPISAVAETSPELAEMIADAVEQGLKRSATKRTSKNRRKLTMTVLGSVLSLLVADYGVVPENLEAVKTAVEWTLRYVARHGTTPPHKG